MLKSPKDKWSNYLNKSPVFSLGAFIQFLLFAIADVEDSTERQRENKFI